MNLKGPGSLPEQLPWGSWSSSVGVTAASAARVPGGGVIEARPPGGLAVRGVGLGDDTTQCCRAGRGLGRAPGSCSHREVPSNDVEIDD